MNLIAKASRAAAVSALAFAALGAIPTLAHAVVLQIDASRSSVTYTPGGFPLCGPDGTCGTLPPPQTFALSGSLDLLQETVFVTTSFSPLDGYEQEQIRFDSSSIDSGGASAAGFVFPGYFAVRTGQGFAASENWCSWLASFTCLMGYSGSYAGAFDGTTLSMTGIDYAGDSAFPSRFNFTLVARVGQASDVPEPGVLACLAMGMLGLGMVRRRTAALRP